MKYPLHCKSFKLLVNDIVLLCTDGLYKAVDDGGILQFVNDRSPEASMCAMIDNSDIAFDDNTTCIIIKYNKREWS